MKNLSLFLFAMLILGCGTETPVVEEPEPVIEEPPPVVMEAEFPTPPQIVGGSVFDGRVDVATLLPLPCSSFPCSQIDGKVDVDPELLNRDGIILEFTELLSMYTADIQSDHGWHLNWSPRDIVDGWDLGNQVHLMPIEDSRLLEYNTRYVIEIFVQGFGCRDGKTTIIFRTKPK